MSRKVATPYHRRLGLYRNDIWRQTPNLPSHHFLLPSAVLLPSSTSVNLANCTIFVQNLPVADILYFCVAALLARDPCPSSCSVHIAIVSQVCVHVLAIDDDAILCSGATGSLPFQILCLVFLLGWFSRLLETHFVLPSASCFCCSTSLPALQILLPIPT